MFVQSSIAIIAGILLGWFVQLATWRMRERYLKLAALLGTVCAGGIVYVAAMYLSSPYVGEIHETLRWALILLCVVAFFLGLFHARVLRASFLACVLAVFIDVAAALGMGAAGAGIRDWLIMAHGVDAHPLYTSFLIAFTLALAFLLILRPLRQRKKRRRPYSFI